MKTTLRKITAGSTLFWAAAVCSAQQPPSTPVQNVVQLSASASAELPNDWMSLVMSTVREGADAQAVQGQLKTALETALSEARSAARPDGMSVRTGGFSLAPRYDRDGRISAWQGTAELVLEGREFARISTTAGRIQSLTVARVAFSLSKAQKERAESEVQARAIERFKARASEIAGAFGFSSYALREAAVQTSEQNQPPRPYMLAMEARGAQAEAALPAEAGKGTLTVTVSGSIQLK